MTPEEEKRADSCKCEACAMRRAMEEQGRELVRVIKERDEALRELDELKAGREALRCPVA